MSQNKRRIIEDEIADMDEGEEEDSLSNRFLTFKVGEENYGIEILYVTEIVGIQKITQVPDMPDFVKGVINLRGQVIPVMDIRLRFQMEPREYDARTCVIVVKIEETQVGLIVDRVNEVMEIGDSCISDAPKMTNSLSSHYIKGMGRINDEVKILLDVNKILFEKELAQLIR